MKKTLFACGAIFTGLISLGQSRDSLTYFDPHLSNFDPGEIVQYIRPARYDGELNNPHEGVATFQRLAGEDLYPGFQWDDSKAPLTFEKPPATARVITNYPSSRIAYLRWKWADLEPQKGKIRFDIIENALVAAAERGQTIEARFQPFTGEDMPEWYWKTGAKVDKAYQQWRKVAIPDHNDPRYVKYFGEFITALGKRFDGRAGLDCVDLAYGGEWGEMGGNASSATAQKLVDIFYKAFPTTTLILMAGSPGCEYASRHTSRTVGWRMDCFGDLSKGGWRNRDTTENSWNHMYSAYPTLYEVDGLKDKWKTAPVILETCGSVASWYYGGYDIDRIFETALRMHASVFMPKSVKIPDEAMPKVIAFNKKIGYRFSLYNMTLPKKITRGQPLLARTTIDNEGVAPIYARYTFAIRAVQGDKQYIYHSSQDIRSWMPLYSYFEDRIQLPAIFQPGEVQLSCALVNKADVPSVKLAIKEIDADGWHPLTSVQIE